MKILDQMYRKVKWKNFSWCLTRWKGRWRCSVIFKAEQVRLRVSILSNRQYRLRSRLSRWAEVNRRVQHKVSWTWQDCRLLVRTAIQDKYKSRIAIRCLITKTTLSRSPTNQITLQTPWKSCQSEADTTQCNTVRLCSLQTTIYFCKRPGAPTKTSERTNWLIQEERRLSSLRRNRHPSRKKSSKMKISASPIATTSLTILMSYLVSKLWVQKKC